MTRRGQAFTLIELLVVISIIAILASMLLPAISLVRGTARTAICANNQRQIGMALHSYANDWDGQIPYWEMATEDMGGAWGAYGVATLWGQWTAKVAAQLDVATSTAPPFLLCPDGNWRRGQQGISEQVLMLSHYGMNMALPSAAVVRQGMAGGPSAIRLNGLPRASGTILISEEWGINTDGGFSPLGAKIMITRGYVAGDRRTPTANGPLTYAAWRLSHRRKANILCVDGHVELAAPADTGVFLADSTHTGSVPSRWFATY